MVAIQRAQILAEDSDLLKLYSKRILALAADIPHTDRLSDPHGTARKRSPLCGSTVSVDIKLEDGRISEYGQDVKACALGQASAAVIGENIIGRSLDEVLSARKELAEMLKSNGAAPKPPFDGLEALLPARDFKNRHASILLTFDAIVEAITTADVTA